MIVYAYIFGKIFEIYDTLKKNFFLWLIRVMRPFVIVDYKLKFSVEITVFVLEEI